MNLNNTQIHLYKYYGNLLTFNFMNIFQISPPLGALHYPDTYFLMNFTKFLKKQLDDDERTFLIVQLVLLYFYFVPSFLKTNQMF